MSRWLYQLSYRSSGASFGQNTLFRSIHLHGPDRANTDAARAYCTLFLVECKKARFDVDGQRAVHMPHCIHLSTLCQIRCATGETSTPFSRR